MRAGLRGARGPPGDARALPRALPQAAGGVPILPHRLQQPGAPSSHALRRHMPPCWQPGWAPLSGSPCFLPPSLGCVGPCGHSQRAYRSEERAYRSEERSRYIRSHPGLTGFPLCAGSDRRLPCPPLPWYCCVVPCLRTQVTLGSLDEHLQHNVVQHVSLFLEAFKARACVVVLPRVAAASFPPLSRPIGSPPVSRRNDRACPAPLEH